MHIKYVLRQQMSMSKFVRNILLSDTHKLDDGIPRYQNNLTTSIFNEVIDKKKNI